MVDEALLRELDRYIKRHYIEDEFYRMKNKYKDSNGVPMSSTWS